MSKQASTATNVRKRRAALNHIRKQLTIQYHALSGVMCDDRISPRQPKGGDVVVLPEGMTPDQVIVKPPELDTAFDHISDAINCLNRELGRKENSRADGDGSS